MLCHAPRHGHSSDSFQSFLIASNGMRVHDVDGDPKVVIFQSFLIASEELKTLALLYSLSVVLSVFSDCFSLVEKYYAKNRGGVLPPFSLF